MGATATGKSAVAVHIAEVFDGEIISMDSRQVYRGMNIGTAKVSEEMLSRVPHHLIDILDPKEQSSAGQHVALAEECLADIQARKKLPILVGGTGLYFRALFHGLIEAGTGGAARELRAALAAKSTQDLYQDLMQRDPERAMSLSPNDRVRIMRALEIYFLTGRTYSEHLARQQEATEWQGLKVVLTMNRVALRERIAERTREMFQSGWDEEVRRLLAGGYAIDAPGMNSLGYGLIARAIHEGTDPNSVIGDVITLTQQYAKRQETYFRSMSGAVWIDVLTGDPVFRVTRLCAEHLNP
jgi:tRNA dimethylallyltransferase